MSASGNIDEGVAIKLLQLLVGHSEYVLGPGAPSKMTPLNIECGAHAFVASLALAISGQKVRLAKGQAFVFTEKKIFPQLNHFFVVRESDGKVFDSSITIPLPPEETKVRFKGIGFSRCPECPDLHVVRFSGKPKGSEQADLKARAETSPVAMYIESEAWPPQDAIEMKLARESGFGKWVEQNFGSQHWIWPRFAWVIATELKGEAVYICLDRDKLIEKVKKTSPDIDHKIRNL